MISLIFLPFLACMVLVLIHVYFGVFVLRRGVLFIDLALAQWAALGYLVGRWADIDNHYILFLIGFSFTIVASLILTVLKPFYNKINLQEAVIGVMYIIATATATGVISSTGMDGHHLREMLAGHLLFIQPTELIIAYGLYLGIGLLLISLHRYFLTTSSQKWNIVFYILFGAVVTSSVKMVGVLLVFSFLVIPLLSAVMFTNTFKHQVLIGWGIGISASLVGLFVSMIIDVPPSYCVMLILSLIWGLSVILKYLLSQKERPTIKRITNP
ncbi:MAG: metal ABC transporter permease [bacterium]